MTVEYPLAARIAAAVRARSAVPIVMGGAHVNAVRESLLEECEAADFACIGEGEHLAVELAAAIASHGDLSKIPGLAWRRDGRVVRNPARVYHDDYDALPFPAWDLFETRTEIPLLTHRGCPFECNFCAHNSGFKPRYRSAENVLAEIEYVIDRFHPRNIRIEDETFGLNMPRTRKILEGVEQRGLARRVSFSAQTRVDRVDRDFIALLKRCNFAWLEIGVESGSPEILQRMGKGITLDQVARAIEFAKAEKLKIWTKFILGHPYETRENMMETARFIARVNPDRLSVAIMTPYPGTPIFDMAIRGEGNYRMLSDDWGAFDRFSNGALELEDVPLSQIKLMQLYCYLNLYFRNGRVIDFSVLAARHFVLVLAMLRGVASTLFGGDRTPAPGALRPRPLDQRIASVTSPDATLVQLQRRGPAPAMTTGAKPVRSWAAPGQ
jgi:radical SAM superfamily enzyme YgiQ (UPF0313 family)